MIVFAQNEGKYSTVKFYCFDTFRKKIFNYILKLVYLKVCLLKYTHVMEVPTQIPIPLSVHEIFYIERQIWGCFVLSEKLFSENDICGIYKNLSWF